MRSFYAKYTKLMESFDVPYGFVVWPNGNWNTVEKMGGHEDIIGDKITVPEDENHSYYYYFFKSGGIRMTKENDKYWIEADLTKVNRKNIKLATDLALMQNREGKITHISYSSFF